MKGIGFYGEDFFTIKTDNDLIRENITRILLTSFGERVMSNFGSRLKEFIFDPDTVLQGDVNSEIRRAITRWEPRVDIQSIDAQMTENNKVEIVLSLINKETLEPFSYETIIRY